MMRQIGILSDTHSSLPGGTQDFLTGCDEIWHAGDIGSLVVIRELEQIAPVRAVYGNIDGSEARGLYPELQCFDIEEIKVLMIHIGGYPGKYTAQARKIISSESPGLVVTGHSHILKIIYDQKNEHLHINPGAAGKFGMHKLRTMVRLTIDGSDIRDLEIREIPR